MRFLLLILSLMAPWPALAGSPRLAAQIKKEYEWEKPEWAKKSSLKPTKNREYPTQK